MTYLVELLGDPVGKAMHGELAGREPPRLARKRLPVLLQLADVIVLGGRPAPALEIQFDLFLEIVERHGLARKTGAERQPRAIDRQWLKREPPEAILGEHELGGGKQHRKIGATARFLAQPVDMRERLVIADQGRDAVFVLDQKPGPV